VDVVALLSQGRTAAAQCGLFTRKSVPVIFEPPCIFKLTNRYNKRPSLLPFNTTRYLYKDHLEFIVTYVVRFSFLQSKSLTEHGWMLFSVGHLPSQTCHYVIAATVLMAKCAVIGLAIVSCSVALETVVSWVVCFDL